MFHEFQSILYPTRAALCDAIAEQWMTAGGSNTEDFVRQCFSETDDDLGLAREAIDGWGLDVEWQDARGINPLDIAAGFMRLRASFVAEG